jgi:hypothetical protein
MSGVREQSGTEAVSYGSKARLRGRLVRVHARANPAEIARREEFRLVSLTSPPLLAALASLPAAEAVRWSQLNRRTQRVLRAAPDGVLERVGSRVMRLAVSPVVVESITVEARLSRAGLEAASVFAPFCRRSVCLPRSSVDEAVLLDAAFYGIGVLVYDNPQAGYLVEPEPYVVRRWTWASWQFHEEAWEQLRNADGRLDRPRRRRAV